MLLLCRKFRPGTGLPYIRAIQPGTPPSDAVFIMKIGVFSQPIKSFLLAFTLLLSSVACAASEEDPLEPLNRKIFAFNDFLDRILIKPLALGYNWITPEPVDRSITNFFNNLDDLGISLNNLLQGKIKDAGSDVARFGLNSTLGLVGLFDVASPIGLTKHDEDFGQTFAVWGVPQGPYIVLPLFGPATARSAVGRVPDYFTQPESYIQDRETRYGLKAVELIDKRSDLLALDENVTGDKYLLFRDVYLQRRAFLVNDGFIEEDPFTSDDLEDY